LFRLILTFLRIDALIFADRGVNWTTTPFTGQIDHHENAKHGHFAPDVKTRQHDQKALFTSDPRVQHRTSGADETTPEVNGFVAGLRSLFNGNFSNSTAYGKNEPKSFGGHTGFPDDIARNQREISRLVRLLLASFICLSAFIL
jgi:hypothetical protein